MTPDPTTAPGGRLTVAICTRGRDLCLSHAVESILVDPLEDVQLIVVDQNDDDRVEVALGDLADDPRLTHVRLDVAGAGRARNIAIELASTPVVCFTDDDCVVPPGWARDMTERLLERPESALIFCSVVDPNESDDRLGYTPDFPIDREIVLDSWGLAARVDRLGIGAGMAVRRAEVGAIGGFDPLMGPGSRFPSADDREMAIRLILEGHEVMMTPDVSVEHHGFRMNGSEARALTKRDHLALGAMLAKMVDVELLRSLGHLVLFLGVSVVGAVRDTIRFGRPAGVGKLRWTVAGFVAGRRQPRHHGEARYVDTADARHTVVTSQRPA